MKPPCTAHYFFIKKNNLGQYRGGGVQKRDDVPLSRPRKGGVGTPGTQQSLDTGGPPRLSPELKSAFPDVTPAERPLILDPKITNPHWLAGFTSGEGCFLIKITKSSTLIGWRVLLVFQITQHVRDEQLIKSLIAYLDCGTIYKTSTRPNEVNFIVTKFSDIIGKIIPFFQSNHPINGVKALDFLDWCRVAQMMKEKKHLTKVGLEQIRRIKAGMNTGRKN